MRSILHTLPLLALAALAACGGGSSGSSGLTLNSTTVSIALVPRITIAERWMAFLGDEATTGPGGTDFNLDGDTVDDIAVVVNLATRDETVLNVAAQRLHWAGSNLYLVVSEAEDGVDWEVPPDPTDKLVLLHWSSLSGVLTFVDTLADDIVAVVGLRVYYASDSTTLMSMESNIRLVDTAISTTLRMPVVTNDAGGSLVGVLLGEDEGLVFLLFDEAAGTPARDLNNDADMIDQYVLALLDGTLAAGVIQSVELALEDDSGPFRARAGVAGDWLAGFLVSEAAQGGVSLNDCSDFTAAWHPTQCGGCLGNEDIDTTDQVLHYLHFANWFANPLTDPPRNSGLAGGERVVAVNNFVGTDSPEADDGCDLNNDGDTTDTILRWTEAFSFPDDVVPATDEMVMHARSDLPGGPEGITELSNRWILVVDETEDNDDINGDGDMDDDLVGWLDPTTAGPFTFDHEPGPLTAYVGASWMGEQPARTTLPVDLSEEVFGGPINSSDMDTLDFIPTFARFAGSELLFPGVAIAVMEGNAGIVVAKNLAMYRIDEVADSRDWNLDGDMLDILLFRTSISSGFSTYVDFINTDPGPATYVDFVNTFGAAYIVDEAAAGADINGDGDMLDDVLRWFRY